MVVPFCELNVVCHFLLQAWHIFLCQIYSLWVFNTLRNLWFLLEPKCLQLFLVLTNFSKRSCRSQKCGYLDTLNHFSDFLFSRSFFYILSDYSGCSDYYWYYWHLHKAKIQILTNFLAPLIFWTNEDYELTFSFPLVTRSRLLTGIGWYVFIAKSQRILSFYFLIQFLHFSRPLLLLLLLLLL